MNCHHSGFVLTNGFYTIAKSEHAELVYGLDLRLWAADDPVVSVLAVEADGVELVNWELQGQVALVKLKGGEVGTTATVLIQWRTQSGQEDARTLVFEIRPR